MQSMRSVLVTASFAVALGLATAASAETATGTISQVDLATNRITLSNGDIFKLGTGLGASHYQVGQQAQVTWSGYDQGYKAADGVTVVAQADTPSGGDPFFNEASPETGTIANVDLGTNRITLSNGDIFKLGTGLGASHYRVGEQVRVSWQMGNLGYKEAYRVIPIV